MTRTADPVRVGDRLGPEDHATSTIQLFRYSAATWNSHRIHYDQAYAAHEGYPGVLVQSHLHGAFLTALCTNWIGNEGEFVSLSVSVRRFATAGETLRCEGRIERIEPHLDGHALVTASLTETNERGDVCAPATAVFRLPLSRIEAT